MKKSIIIISVIIFLLLSATSAWLFLCPTPSSTSIASKWQLAVTNLVPHLAEPIESPTDDVPDVPINITEPINLVDLLTLNYSDFIRLFNQPVEIRGNGTWYRFSNGLVATFYIHAGTNSISLQSVGIDYRQANDRLQFHFNGINGTFTPDDVIARLGPPDGGASGEFGYEPSAVHPFFIGFSFDYWDVESDTISTIFLVYRGGN